jgi:hypothetical protein
MRKSFGNDLILGQVAGTNRLLRFPRESRATHLYVCGSTGTGKSKFLENLIRQDIIAWPKSKCGLLLLDPHGSLYDSLMRWLAWREIDRPIIPIDLRRDDWIVAYNVLRERPHSDPAVIVSNFVQAMAYVWGASDTKKTPLFARWASNVLWTLYEKKKTLLEAEFLIEHLNKTERYALTQNLRTRSLAQAWAFANTLSPKDFDLQISSTVNRLRTFLSTQLLRGMFGQPGPSLDLGKAIDEGQIILVNLATENNRVSDEDSSLFATLLLSDLWTAARERGKGTDQRDVKPFYVYVDEFQNFITPTIAKNLDQARGYGLHLTLANQFPRQILHVGAHGPEVYDSVIANARSKVVFETRGEENLRPLALDLFMGTMNPDEIKLQLYSTKIMEYREENRDIHGENASSGCSHGTQQGHASGTGAGGTDMFLAGGPAGGPQSTSDSWSEFSAQSGSETNMESQSASTSKSTVPMLIPVIGKELAHVQFRSLEEQLFRAMAVLHDQAQRHCVTRLVGMKAPASLVTPVIRSVPTSEERANRYLERCYGKLPFALPSAQAQKQLAERAKNITQDLLKEATQEAQTAKRRLK